MRVVAVDVAGQEHGPSETRSANAFGGGVGQVTATFQKLPLKKIKEFRLQTRPCQWVIFRNVAAPSRQEDGRADPRRRRNDHSACSGCRHREAAGDGRHAGGRQRHARVAELVRKAILAELVQHGPGWRELDAIALSHKAWVMAFSHSTKHYQTILSLSQPGSLIVLSFALDSPDKDVPAEYKELLPVPWPEIEAALKRGETVERSGMARQRRIVLLAAPTETQLFDLIHRTRLLTGMGVSPATGADTVATGNATPEGRQAPTSQRPEEGTRGGEGRQRPRWYSAGPAWKELTALLWSRGVWLRSFNHSAEHYRTILADSQPGSTIILLFALDHPDKDVPAEYQDLLSMPWPEIEAALKKGETVKRSGSARQRRIVLLAAPTVSQLVNLVHRTRLLPGPGGDASPGRNGNAPAMGSAIQKPVVTDMAADLGDKLTEGQRLYCRWDAATFGLPDLAQWQNLGPQEKAAKKEELLKQLSRHEEAQRVKAIDGLVALGSKQAVPAILQIAVERRRRTTGTAIPPRAPGNVGRSQRGAGPGSSDLSLQLERATMGPNRPAAADRAELRPRRARLATVVGEAGWQAAHLRRDRRLGNQSGNAEIRRPEAHGRVGSHADLRYESAASEDPARTTPHRATEQSPRADAPGCGRFLPARAAQD